MHDSRELQRLTALWEEKLKASGFKDIERTVAGERLFKRFDSIYFGGHWTADQMDLTREYYSKCEHALLTHAFTDETDKAIWQLHSQGKSAREIALKLRNKQRKLKLNKDNVSGIIRRIRKDIFG